MDFSEQYIKMCDCPEIQTNKEWSEWLWMFAPGYGIAFDNGDGVWARVGPGASKDRCIKLPRQSQVQEWIFDGYDDTNLQEFIDEIYGYDTYENVDRLSASMNRPYNNLKSFEQLWLSFYMHEKHGKAWDGEKWVIHTNDCTL